MTQLAGEYDYWFQVLEKDDDELIEYYRDVLKNMFLCENRSDKRSPLDYTIAMNSMAQQKKFVIYMKKYLYIRKKKL